MCRGCAILRLGNVYGPGKSKSGGPGVVFAFAMLRGERPVIHWYNQRGEHSANHIKELKCDFAGDRLPHGQFSANELYALCALSYNLFALLRHLLPVAGSRSRAPTVRWRLIAPWRANWFFMVVSGPSSCGRRIMRY